LTELERFSKDYPKSPLLGEVLVEAGEVCFVLKQYEKGIGYLNKALEAHAASLVAKRAYLGLEEGYRSLRRYDQAEKALKELIAKFPGDDVVFDGQLRLGLLLLSQKRFREAVEPLSQASRSPEERIASQADFKLGEVYQEMGNRELAVAQFSKVVYLYPHRADLGEEALLRLGGLYLEQRKFPEAKLAYRKLLEKTKREDRRELAQKKLAEIEKGKVP
jgi:tetratricopeptide (TPR) repeat protein